MYYRSATVTKSLVFVTFSAFLRQVSSYVVVLPYAAVLVVLPLPFQRHKKDPSPAGREVT